LRSGGETQSYSNVRIANKIKIKKTNEKTNPISIRDGNGKIEKVFVN